MNTPALSQVFLLLLIASGELEQPSGTIALTLQLPGAQQPEEETVVLWPGESAEAPIEFEIRIPGTASVEAPAGDWTLSFKQYDRHWFQPQTVAVVAGSRTELTAAAVRTAEVAGSLKASGGVETPSDVEVYFERSHDGPAVGAKPALFGRRKCSVADFEWRCFLPADHLDLRVVIPGYSDLFYWDTRLTPGALERLSAKRLQEGSTVFGWIVRPDGEALAGAAVELAPARLLVADFPGAGLRTIRARTDARGFFQLPGARSGAYTLRAVAEEVQSAEFAVEVIGSSVAVDPAIVLYPPHQLDVYLEPQQSPSGEPWEMEIYPAWDGALVNAQQGLRTDLSGFVAVGDLPAGRYYLIVNDPASGSRWATEEATVHGDSDEVLALEIEILPVEGSVELGSDPVEVTLSFADRAEESSVTLATDAEGEFRGAIPGEGAYIVEVTGSGIHYEQQIQVEAGPGGVARFDLKIPDTLIEGQVVEAGRGPVRQATLMLDGDGKPRSLAKLDSGEFEVRGLEPGTYRITAASVSADGRPLASIEPEVVHLDGNDTELRGVTIEVEPIRVISGRVVSDRDGAPIPGAQVWAMAPGAFPLAFLATADGDGRFESRVPKTDSPIQVILEPPGHAFEVRRIPASDDVTLVAASEYGSLKITTYVDDWWWGSPRLYLFSETGALRAALALSWARSHGVRVPVGGPIADSSQQRQITLPAMAPGKWSVCLVEPDQVRMVAIDPTVRLPSWICDAGILRIGEELSLRVESPRQGSGP